MCKHVKFFPSSRFIIILAILSLGFALVACGGSSTKKDEKSAESTGSLTRTYKIIDEKGLESGTLTLVRYRIYVVVPLSTVIYWLKELAAHRNIIPMPTR